jgi:UDP-glucose 4-epimerase
MVDERRVLVTGGAGFIGSHLVDRLVARGDRVTVLDDLSGGSAANVAPGAELLRLDLESAEARDAVTALAPTAIVHCAAQASVPGSFADPVRDARSNIVGSLRLVDAARAAGTGRFVYITTGGALFGRPMTAPWRETDPIDPISPYGISKSTVETYLGVLPPAPVTSVLRLANVYGPRQGASGEAGVVAVFLDQMTRGLPVVIHGDGEQTRDLVYVGDVVDAVEAVLATDDGGVYNVGTGIGTSVNALFRELARLTGYEAEPAYGAPRIGDIRHSALDVGRARAALGWAAVTSLEQGLRATLEGRG